MDVGKQMRSALNGYLKEVTEAKKKLEEAEKVAEAISVAIQRNEEINAQTEAASEEVAYLYGQREELYASFHDASFEGDAEEINRIRAEKERIDNRLEELHESVEELRSKVVDVDGTAVQEMLVSVDKAEVSAFFGPRIEGAKYQLLNSSYKSTSPVGLLADLQSSNDELMHDMNVTKARIRGMQQWWKYVPSKAPTASEVRLREAVAARDKQTV